jgi:glyoxylate/hydroxypyruvate reductase A
MAASDILMLLLPETPETLQIIRRETLQKCKGGVYIINVGRGSSINDDDLLEALQKGTVAGATLDVFHEEPLPLEHPYWKHPKVLITPHIAAKSWPSTASVVIAENIRRCESGEPLLYVVNRDTGY